MKAFIRLYVFRSIWIIMAVGGLHATADCSRAQHKIFDASVIQKWKDYEAFSHGLQGTARSQGIRNGKPQESTKRYKQNRECALVIGPHNREPSLLSCWLTNSHYMATISLRKSDQANAVLRKYTPPPGATETLSSVNYVFYETSRHFAYSQSSRLREVVSNPSFKVTKVVKETQNGQELIRVDYIYNYVFPVANQDGHTRVHGSLWLDSSRCWSIRRIKSSNETMTGGERSSDTEIEVVCETIDHPSGFPILKSRTDHVKMFYYKNKRTTEETRKINYDLEVNDSVPDSEFTLSAFGLPEPASKPGRRSRPLFVWLLVAGGISCALAVGFRVLARRARAKPAA